MLYAAIQSVRHQDYEGPMSIVVVFDAATPDEAMQQELRSLGVRWVSNSRTRGLPGARNTGVLELDCDLIAFCDDDDTWYPAKLRRQVLAWERDPAAVMMASAITVIDPHGVPHVRLAGADRVHHVQLLRSRMGMIHSSTFLFSRRMLVDMGLFDESAPRGHNEDWDILLRASRLGPIGVVDEPLVSAPWGATSYFTYDFASKVDSFDWIMDNHPDLAADRAARGHILARKAYWQACAGDPAARQTARESLRAGAAQPKAYLALLASTPLLSGTWFLSVLNRVGKGV
jgi:glycosyltransferase involved in cell wall biosynthesis